MAASATPRTVDTLVVPTARQAAALRRDFARRQRAHGAQCWQAADVLGLGAWLTRASLPARSDGRLPARALLGQEQAHALWAAIVAGDASDDAGHALNLRPAQVDALARLMAEAEDLTFAHGLRAAWQAPLPLTFEQTLARHWHQAFRRRCETLGVSTRTMLLEACVARGVVLAGTASASRGFEAGGAMLRSLLPVAEAGDSTGGRPRHRIYASVDEECDAALDWARAARAAGDADGVAIVAVDARSLDGLLARAARWRLAAGTPPGVAAELNAPLARLATAPLVEHALLALDSATGLAPAAAITLLTSPYVRGWREEFGARARLAACLQAERTAPLDLATLLALAERAQCSGFVAMLNALRPLAVQVARRQPMSRWAAFAGRWLAVWGWPGGEGLTPQEQAALDAWPRALDTVAALDLVLPVQSLRDAPAPEHARDQRHRTARRGCDRDPERRGSGRAAPGASLGARPARRRVAERPAVESAAAAGHAAPGRRAGQ